MKIKIPEIQSNNLRAAIKIRRRFDGVFLCLFLILILPSAVPIYAKTVAKYRENVKNAKISVEDLIYSDGEEEVTPSDYKKYERQVIAQIRADLPATEKIERDN